MSSVTDVLNKLKQIPQARLSQVVVTLLLIYIASIVANVSWMLIPQGQLDQGMSSPAINANRAANARGAHSDGQSFNVSSLTAMNIFGAHVVKVVEKQPEVIVEQAIIPPTNLNLTLAATVSEGIDSGLGTAIIASSGRQGTYGIDDKIDQTPAIVKKVYKDRVILQNGPKMETLMLDGVEYDQRNVSRTVQTQFEYNEPARDEQEEPVYDQSNDNYNDNNSEQNQDPEPEPLQHDDSDTQKIDNRRDNQLSEKLSRQRADLAENPKKLFELIRFSPVRKAGVLAGYRLNPGSDPDLFKQAGFRPNDLAVEVNGLALNDMQQAMKVLKEFRELSEANIVVERDGVRTEILFSISGSHGQQNERHSKSAPSKPEVRLN